MSLPQWTSRSFGRSTASFQALLSAPDRWRSGAARSEAPYVSSAGIPPLEALAAPLPGYPVGNGRCRTLLAVAVSCLTQFRHFGGRFGSQRGLAHKFGLPW